MNLIFADSNILKFDWSQTNWIASFWRVPALVICICVAAFFHQEAGGVVAAGAALSVGMVGNRRIAGSSLWAAIATTFFMALSAWAGTLVGATPWLNLLVTAVWGLGFAFLTIHDEDKGWIAMQGVVCLVIAVGFPSHGYAALERAAAIATGGMIQIIILATVAGIECLFTRESIQLPEPEILPKVYEGEQILASFTSFSPAWRYALRVALTLMAAVEVADVLHLPNGYWLPMTTVIVLKPDFYRTLSGAVQRVIGTFLGVVAASLIAHLLHPNFPCLVLLVAVFSFGCFVYLKVNPIPFSAALTAYVVFLIAITGLPEATITGHRLVLTALGCGLALASRFFGRESILTLFRERLKN